MINDPNAWAEMQEQFRRLWQSVFEQGYSSIAGGPSSGVGNLWGQFGMGPSAAGPEVFSQWLNKTLQGMLLAPLQGWSFDSSSSTNPFSATGFAPMAPSEFVAMKDLPPLGLNRESQLRWRELGQACTEQANAASKIGRQLAGVYATALKRFQKATMGNDGDANEITSLRELYDLWVSIAEQAYAEKVMTAEYSKDFGECINTSARAQKAWQELTNEAQQAMNLPSRHELDSVIHRQHALQTELHDLKTRLANEDDLKNLRTRLDALNDQVETISLSVPKKTEPIRSRAPKKKMASPIATAAPPKSKRNRATAKKPVKAASRAARSAGEFDIGSIG